MSPAIYAAAQSPLDKNWGQRQATFYQCNRVSAPGVDKDGQDHTVYIGEWAIGRSMRCGVALSWSSGPPAWAATGTPANILCLPHEQHAKLSARAGVTDVTGCT
jgi:hypothetical protein